MKKIKGKSHIYSAFLTFDKKEECDVIADLCSVRYVVYIKDVDNDEKQKTFEVFFIVPDAYLFIDIYTMIFNPMRHDVQLFGALDKQTAIEVLKAALKGYYYLVAVFEEGVISFSEYTFAFSCLKGGGKNIG